MKFPRRMICKVLSVLFAASLPWVARADEEPPLKDGSIQAIRELKALRPPAGMKLELFAAEPQLGNPVALCQDEQGRIFVAEEYRFNRGTEENRTSPWLLDDDLQIKTLDDRLAMYRRHASHYRGGMEWFTKYPDKIRLLEDRNGDGRVDFTSEFARFQEPLDGLAAGLLAHRGELFVTCIPNLWRMRDTKGTGRADVQEKLLTGFGVNAGFLGHDLHGLTWGPDGKLYFSVGDRGYHVDTKEGKTIADPRTGSIFRCNPDGTELEAIFRGLRNPQEIAFDDHGNLFAADNNCDKGDASRLMYIVEGGDGGWRMEYQSLPKPYLAGPWLAEKMWQTEHLEQPAAILPSSGGIGAGPSGFAYYPGTGLAEQYRGRFFLCNFTGNGGIETFTAEPRGAGFQLANPGDFLKPIQASDLEFGYDGKIYVAHFVKLEWLGGNGGGRIYTLFDPQIVQSPEVKQVRELFRGGFAALPTAELAALLKHADLRVRREAQFTLAARAVKTHPEAAAFQALDKATNPAAPLLMRLHGLWGLGQMARNQVPARERIAALLADSQQEVRAHAARLVGVCGHTPAAGQLVLLLKDSSPRVRMFAALALGKLKHHSAAPALVELLRAGGDDAYLRHGAVMGLVGTAEPKFLHSLTRDPSPAVRLGVLLAERRRDDAALVEFLDDADPRIVLEAARAINDRALTSGDARLAQLLERGSVLAAGGEPLIRRCLNACFRIGSAECVQSVLQFALNGQYSDTLRIEALNSLADWTKPSPRDRVNGFWRPLPPRPAPLVAGVVGSRVTDLLNLTGSVDLQRAAVQLIASLDLPLQEATFVEWVRDRQRPLVLRVAALQLLAARRATLLPELLTEVLNADAPLLRAEARDLLVERQPQVALESLRKCLAMPGAEVCEQQRAFAALARLQDPQAAEMLRDWSNRLVAGRVRPELQLDVYMAAGQSRAAPAGTRLDKLPPEVTGVPGLTSRTRLTLYGGDAERGRKVFLENGRLECTRCHKANGNGGTAGPDLSKVATRHTRETLLESLLVPDAKIAPGFGTVSLVLTNGKIVAGVIKSETKERLTLLTPENKELQILLADVEERSLPKSAMPTVAPHLDLREMRDLVEYLASLK